MRHHFIKKLLAKNSTSAKADISSILGSNRQGFGILSGIEASVYATDGNGDSESAVPGVAGTGATGVNGKLTGVVGAGSHIIIRHGRTNFLCVSNRKSVRSLWAVVICFC